MPAVYGIYKDENGVWKNRYRKLTPAEEMDIYRRMNAGPMTVYPGVQAKRPAAPAPATASPEAEPQSRKK